MASTIVLAWFSGSGLLTLVLVDVVVSTSASGAEVVVFSLLGEGTAASSKYVSCDSDDDVLLIEMMSSEEFLRRLSSLFPAAPIAVSRLGKCIGSLRSLTTGASPAFTPVLVVRGSAIMGSGKLLWSTTGVWCVSSFRRLMASKKHN